MKRQWESIAETLGIDLYELARALGLYEDVEPLEIKPDRIAIEHSLNEVPADKLILVKAIVNSYIQDKGPKAALVVSPL